MSSAGSSLLIAPLSLCNALTVLCAFICLWTASPQAKGGVWPVWRLTLPGAFAVIVALVLLCGVFDATLWHDAEWLAALSVGVLIGQNRGRGLAAHFDQSGTLINLPRSLDGPAVAMGVVVSSLIDFTSAALRDPLIDCHHVASAAALCAGFLGGRSLAIVARSGLVGAGRTGARSPRKSM